MSITTKQARCARWVWGAITRYPHLLISELVGMQTDYSEREIALALVELQRQGWVVKEAAGAGAPRGYVALVPFVVQSPTWAV